MNTVIIPAILMNINYHTVALLSKLRGLNVSLAIWPASCCSQLIKVGVVKQLTTNNLTRERTVVYQF